MKIKKYRVFFAEYHLAKSPHVGSLNCIVLDKYARTCNKPTTEIQYRVLELSNLQSCRKQATEQHLPKKNLRSLPSTFYIGP